MDCISKGAQKRKEQLRNKIVHEDTTITGEDQEGESKHMRLPYDSYSRPHREIHKTLDVCRLANTSQTQPEGRFNSNKIRTAKTRMQLDRVAKEQIVNMQANMYNSWWTQCELQYPTLLVDCEYVTRT